MNAFDDALRGADPGTLVDDAWTAGVFEETISLKPTPARKRARSKWVFPVIIVGAIALTGAAYAAIAALSQLGVNGSPVDYDVTVPIEYVDTRGMNHACTFGFYVGDGESKSPQAMQIIESLRERNWDGVGQQVYAYSEERQADGIEGPKDYQHRAAFSRALNRVLVEDLPSELLTGKEVIAGSHNCDGAGQSW